MSDKSIELAVFNILNSASASRISAASLAMNIEKVMVDCRPKIPSTIDADYICANQTISREWVGLMLDRNDWFGDQCCNRNDRETFRRILGSAHDCIHIKLRNNPMLEAIHRKCTSGL